MQLPIMWPDSSTPTDSMKGAVLWRAVRHGASSHSDMSGWTNGAD